MKKELKSFLAISALFFAVTACEQGAKTESTAEQAQKSVEQAAEQTGQAMEKAVDSATETAKDAIGAATDSAEKAADNQQKQN